METDNLFDNLPDARHAEVFRSLAQTDAVRIEHIVSRGQCSPENFWYDQDEHEWVLVLAGRARLQFQDGQRLELRKGDFVNILAHQKHRVDWTDPDQPTVWLAVFYR